jgi:predicted Zn-dependent protease
MNQPEKARDDYQKALALDPGLDKVRLHLAEMYLDDNDPVNAIPHLEILQARQPDRPEVAARLGQCRFLQGRYPEARELLERAVKSMPNDPAVLLFLARLDLDNRHPEQAEKRLRAALTVDPSETEVRYTLVNALRAQGKDAEASAELAEHERHKALLQRANSLLQDEAKKHSTDPAPATEVGGLLLQIGQERQGLYWLNEALNRDPNYRPAHKILADFYAKQGDADRAALHRRAAR